MEVIHSWIATIASIVSIVVLLFAWLKSKGKYEEKVKQNEKNIDILQKDIKDVQKDIKDVQKDIKEIPWKIMNIFGHVLQSKEFKRSSIIKSDSPISLSDKGINLAQELGVDDILDKYIKQLQDAVFTLGDKNPYEIQENSKIIVEKQLLSIISDEEKNRIENFAYEEGIDIDTVYILFSIILRDRILANKKYPNKNLDKSF